MNASRSRAGLGLNSILVLATWVFACSSTKSSVGGSLVTSTAAAVLGAADSHCTGKPVVVARQAACHVDAGDVPADDAGAADGGAPVSDYGDTLFNSEGDDDDCKYHVKWQATAVAQNSDVTFVVVAANKNDGSPVTGANPYAELFLNDTHPAPNTAVATTETSPGTYTIGPVRFDAAGKWTTRFHFAAECGDGPESPHGHIAFFVQVP